MPEKTVSRAVEGAMVHAGCSRRPRDGQGQEAQVPASWPQNPTAVGHLPPCVRGYHRCSLMNTGLA